MTVFEYLKGFHNRVEVLDSHLDFGLTCGQFHPASNTIKIFVMPEKLNTLVAVTCLAHELGHAYHEHSGDLRVLFDVKYRLKGEKEAWAFAVKLLRELGILQRYRRQIAKRIKSSLLSHSDSLSYLDVLDRICLAEHELVQIKLEELL